MADYNQERNEDAYIGYLRTKRFFMFFVFYSVMIICGLIAIGIALVDWFGLKHHDITHDGLMLSLGLLLVMLSPWGFLGDSGIIRYDR